MDEQNHQVEKPPETSCIEIIITPREKDIGGFCVRRLLPYSSHRTVGPFIFFDHIGPARFSAGQGMDVRPHPHINLSTVTYLFEGRIHHRDSLGSDQIIEPGAINWMTAGRGIVHSERTTALDRANGSRLAGIQLWVALPAELEESSPSFTHYAKTVLPEFSVGEVQIKLLMGEWMNHKSPVAVASDLFYAEAHFSSAARLSFAADGRERAVYVVDGSVEIDGQVVSAGSMAVLKDDRTVVVCAKTASHLMLLGGVSVGPRFIEWNFVSSSKERISEAKKAWLQGPGPANPRFFLVPSDSAEFIPLPAEPAPRTGTIL